MYNLLICLRFITVEEASGSTSTLGPDYPNLAPITYNISLPAESFQNISTKTAGLVFSFYSTSALFPLRINQSDIDRENSTYKSIGSSVISATVANQMITNLKNPINITMEVNIFVSSK